MGETERGEELKTRDLLLLLIASAEEGSAELGRTSLQKAAYFVGRRLHRDLGHHAHFYGPFANTVERETETLVLSDLLTETVHPLGFANAQGFPARQYEYKLTEEGRHRVRTLRVRYSDDATAVQMVVQALIKRTGRLDQRVLSSAAKVDFIASQQQGEFYDVESVKLAAQDFGWELNGPQVESVLSLLSDLELS